MCKSFSINLSKLFFKIYTFSDLIYRLSNFINNLLGKRFMVKVILMTVEIPKSLEENLEPNEEILCLLKKVLGIEKPKWLVVTNKRIIYFDEKIFGRYDFVAIPYEKLEDVHFKKSKIGSSFLIRSEDNKKINIAWLQKDEAIKAIETIKNAINKIAVEPISIEKKKGFLGEEWILHKPREAISRTISKVKERKSEEDVFEKLKKLKELYDMGIISEDEYEEKRRKLLEKI